MGFRFRRSIKILPGVRLNFSGSGASVTVGQRGLHYTVGPKGNRLSAGIPGTGLSWSQYYPHGQKPAAAFVEPVDLVPATSIEPSGLKTIECASAATINSISTSDLVPLLNSANHRIQIAPFVLIVVIAVFCISLFQPNTSLVGFSSITGLLFLISVYPLDRYRRTIKIALEPEGIALRITETLKIAFNELTSCAAAWLVTAQRATEDWKRNAGATKLNHRDQTSFQFGRPRCIRGNVAFPCFRGKREELYLLPDAALALIDGEIAAIPYRELKFDNDTVRFIEEAAPSDTNIVDYTWRYVNKKGGPDRRFINNKQLPVCLYGEITFRSDSGLYCKFQTSKASAANSLAKMLQALKETTAELPKSINYIQLSKRWPTTVFLMFFSIFTAVQIILLYQSDFNRPDSQPTSVETSQASSPQPQAVAPNRNVQAKNATSLPGSPIDIRLLASPINSQEPLGISSERPPQALDLNDSQNIRAIQLRLRQLGYLHAHGAESDSRSKQALREFKTVNSLPPDDRWDLTSQERLMSNGALPYEQTYLGSWSEGACDAGAKPDITITSRGATSSSGGHCTFSNVRSQGQKWTMTSNCTNLGERWTTNIDLAIEAGRLIWTGRDGSETAYARCR